jgi:hypothetical protein
MTDTSVRSVLQDDIGVQKMVRLYASLNDWYDNIHQARRGVRACERVCRVRDRGLVPLAQRYFEFVADTNKLEFDSDPETLLQNWADLYRPDYVEESEEHDWDEWSRSLCRVHLDPEIRIASTAHETSIQVNNHTINAYNIDRVDDELESEFESLWKDWWHRMDDLYWNRRNRIYKQIVREMEKDILQSEDKTWEKRKERYPNFPYRTRIGGEKQY